MNGYIKYKITVGGGTDEETGAAIAVTSTWSNLVECKYSANELSNKGRYDGGTFKQVSYTITTDEMEFTSKSVKLFDCREFEICEKEVISLEVLEAVQRVKIVI